MSWWASFKNIYGIFMGTSTDLMKSRQRPHWPTALYNFDTKLKVFLGGTGNCGVLVDGGRVLAINCNSGRSALKLGESLAGLQLHTLIGTSAFDDYIGGLSELQFTEIYLPQYANEQHRHLPVAAHLVSRPFSFKWGDEEVQVDTASDSFSKFDLVVYLPRRQVLFLGGLFYNQIHPFLAEGRGDNPLRWRQQLQILLEKYPATTVVPHEGDLCGPLEVQLFMSYLESLADPKIEFSYCRQHFDWREVPGYTSLEENFALLRSRG